MNYNRFKLFKKLLKKSVMYEILRSDQHENKVI